MFEGRFNIAELILIAGTRMALGTGIGLLLAGRLNRDQRKSAGLALAVVGGMTTVPLIVNVISKRNQGRGELRTAA